MDKNRILNHPVLGPTGERKKIKVIVDGREIWGYENEMIAATLTANGIRTFRKTKKKKEPRGVFCAIGKCTDCVMTVNGQPNVRTCVTPIEEGMVIETQIGLGKWGVNDD